MYLFRILKDRTLVQLDQAETHEEIEDKFEREVICMKFRGLKEVENKESPYMKEFTRDGVYECTLLIADTIAVGVTQEDDDYDD